MSLDFSLSLSLSLSLSPPLFLSPLFHFLSPSSSPSPSLPSLSNFLLRSLPTPVHDIAKVVSKDGVEEAMSRIQRYLCRNHSDERFTIELAKRHQHRLLLTSQQSVSIIIAKWFNNNCYHYLI